MPRICVIGAGPSGLVATKTLHQAGLEVDCLELSSTLGGHWAYDNPNGRSAVYRSIHTNTTLAMSRLSDFEMPSGWDEFPTHERVLEWWQSYADTFGFRQRIRLGVEVTAARALTGGGWRVESRDASGATASEDYDALLACSGYSWDPRIPDVPGTFDGEVLHAQRYRDPETPLSLSGKRVVVVGIGNTGCEVACEIAKGGAEKVFLAARSGAWILPQFKDGQPAAKGVPMMHPEDAVMAPLRMLPASWRVGAFERLSKLLFERMFGAHMQRLQDLGMPPPPDHPLDKRATVCEALPGALESGAVTARPNLVRFEGDRVVFEDGTVERADVVLYATGYRLRYPYLPAHLVDPKADDLSLFMGTLHPERHDLFVIGVSRPTGAFWPIAEVHARLAAALLSGRYALPEARTVRRRARPILRTRSFNPAIYGLAMREELEKGARRAKKNGSTA